MGFKVVAVVAPPEQIDEGSTQPTDEATSRRAWRAQAAKNATRLGKMHEENNDLKDMMRLSGAELQRLATNNVRLQNTMFAKPRTPPTLANTADVTVAPVACSAENWRSNSVAGVARGRIRRADNKSLYA